MSEAAAATGGMGKVMGGITKMFKGIGKAISSSLGPLGMLLDIFSALGIIQPLLDVLMSFVSILSVAFVPLLVMMLDAITPLIPPFQEMVTALTPIITMVGSLVFGLSSLGMILDLLNLALPYITQALIFLQPYIEGVVGIVNTLANSFKAFMLVLGGDLWTAIVDSMDGGLDPIKNWFKALPGKMADWIEDAIDDAKNKIKEVFTW